MVVALEHGLLRLRKTEPINRALVAMVVALEHGLLHGLLPLLLLRAGFNGSEVEYGLFNQIGTFTHLGELVGSASQQ